MKKLLQLAILVLFVNVAFAAYLRNVPMVISQPNGETIHCFASGDEFFNYLHDANEYTIIQHVENGYYYYAMKEDGKIVPSEFLVGTVDPASVGLAKNVIISPEEWIKRRLAMMQYNTIPDYKDEGRNHGTLNNLVVFIRFSDDSNITMPFTTVSTILNGASGSSMANYFKATSFNHLQTPSTFYPPPSGTQIISYQDTYPRNYFQPYNATTNPNGYQENERGPREQALIKRAVNFIASMVPTSLNIDYDNDGRVDNICFIVKGNVGAWNSLLWPHKWQLHLENVMLNGKRVWTFNMMFEGAGGDSFSVGTFCHEMQHTLDFPDFYHYANEGLTPCGRWDLMEHNDAIPQQSGAYAKWKYGNWAPAPVPITQNGTYNLKSVGSGQTPVSYSIATSDPKQFIVVECRNISDPFDAVYGSGVLIYRINTNFHGNSDYNGTTEFDEVYIFRPSGTATQNGTISSAHFGSGGRTQFNSSTDPKPFFSNGSAIPNIDISNITYSGGTATFTFTGGGGGEPTTDLTYCTDAIDDGVGTNSPNTLSAAITFPASALNQYVGKKITKIKVAVKAAGLTISNAKVWIRSSLTGYNLVEKSVSFSGDGWNTITLDNPYTITSSDIAIGYTLTTSGGYPLGNCHNTQNAQHGGHVAIGTNWATLQSYGIPGNNCIVGIVEGGGGGGSSSYTDNFEAHNAFTINSPGQVGWSYIDGDGSSTYGFSGITFPNSGSAMAYITFKPSATVPVMTSPAIMPHGGTQFLACFAAENPLNNDWVISPAINASNSFTFSFWAKTYIQDYGLERMKVMYSTSGNAQSNFTNALHSGNYVSVPTSWTQYTYTVPANAKYVAINCVSNDAFVFMIDDISITGILGVEDFDKTDNCVKVFAYQKNISIKLTDDIEQVNFEVFDVLGRNVKSGTCNGQTTFEINQTGMFIVVVRQNNRIIFTRKVMLN